MLRCLDSRQLDKVHCPEAAALCSEARHFAPYWASSVQLRVSRLARGSPNRGNNDDRRQWRKQGVAVGAAASKTQAKRCGCWVPQPGLVERSETERLSLDLFYHFLSQNSKNFGKAIDFTKLKCYAMSMPNHFTILKFAIRKHQRQGGLISPAVPEQEKENPP